MFDTVIRNGQVIDGTGMPARKVDVAVKDGRIVEVGTIGREVEAEREIDAAGRAVSPGFIDIHTHAESSLLENPTAWNYVSQGVTTAIGGNCGGGPFPVRDYAEKADGCDLGINLGLLVGHNTVRSRVMGTENRPSTGDEVREMKDLVFEAMDEGAFGISTGLKYIPGAYAKTDEVIEVVRETAKRGGIYATHMRDEGLDLIESIEEAIEIGREAKAPLQISHYKAVGRKMWGRSEQMLSMVDSANVGDQDVTFDQYPYTASSTGLQILFPAWAPAGGKAACIERWQDPATRQKIREHIVFTIMEDRGGGDPANIVIVSSPYDAGFNGQDLGSISRDAFGGDDIETVAETVIQLAEAGHHSCIYHCIDEDDVQTIMRHPSGVVASDSHTIAPDETHPHPRNFGTFPRVLGRYVREAGVLTLPEAIRKMTGAVADRLGLRDRGVIETGRSADLVVFDTETVEDRATWDDPLQAAVGISHVLVNGRIEMADGQPTDGMGGRFLRMGDA